MGEVRKRVSSRARELRVTQTDAERKLWSIVRNRMLGGFKFRRQVPIGPFIADFVCIDAMLIVELDGSQHAEREDYDAARTRYLEAKGLRVLRFWNLDVLTNIEGVGTMILMALEAPRPPAGEGGARAEGVGG